MTYESLWSLILPRSTKQYHADTLLFIVIVTAFLDVLVMVNPVPSLMVEMDAFVEAL